MDQSSSAQRKALVHKVVAAYLREHRPDEMARFERVFHAVYRAVDYRLQHAAPAQHDHGLPIDLQIADLTSIAAAIMSATVLVRSALDQRRDSDWRTSQERPKRQLEELFPSEMVGAIAERVVAILEDQGPPPEVCDGCAEQADLRLRVDLHRRLPGAVLTFRIACDAAPELLDRVFRSRPLRTELEGYVPSLMRRIERLPTGTWRERETADRRLLGLGTRLSSDLLPPALLTTLGDLRAKVETVLITSDAPWIPWQLLQLPATPGGAAAAFFGEVFSLSYLLQDHPPVCTIPAGRLAIVQPRTSELASSGQEDDTLRTIFRDWKIEYVPATLQAVVGGLSRGRFDAWHFIGHASARNSDPDDWGLLLDDHERLTPADLTAAANGLCRAHPLIVLNACQTGRVGATLTGLGGLAAAFFEAGAAAVVGTSWSVRDEIAGRFSNAFYPLLEAGLPIAEALRRARSVLREAFPGDPSWLAYAAFAHPLARFEK